MRAMLCCASCTLLPLPSPTLTHAVAHCKNELAACHRPVVSSTFFRLGWYQAEYEQNGNGALANGYPYSDEYAFSVTSPLNISKGMTVLDVGCGNGYMIGLLWKYTDIRISGIDPLPFFVMSANRAYPDGSFCEASASSMPGVCRHLTSLIVRALASGITRTSDAPANFADAVIMNFPLNHLNDEDALLSVKEVKSRAHMLRQWRLTCSFARCGAFSRAAALHSSVCRTGDCAACSRRLRE